MVDPRSKLPERGQSVTEFLDSLQQDAFDKYLDRRLGAESFSNDADDSDPPADDQQDGLD